MRRSNPLAVWFRRSDWPNHNHFAGRIRIYYFTGRLLSVDRLLTNEMVLAVLRPALVWFGFWLILIRTNNPFGVVFLNAMP